MPRSVEQVCAIVAAKATSEERAELLYAAAKLTDNDLMALGPAFANEDDVIKFLRKELERAESGSGQAGAGARAGAAADAKPSDTSSEAVTIELVIPAVLHGFDYIHAIIAFDDEESFKEYLRCEQCGGLTPVDEQQPKVVVNKFAQLDPGVIYTHSPGSKEAFARVLGEVRHLQQSREDEFAKALTEHVQCAEPEQGYELREDLRMQLIKGNKIAEHDVVVQGKDKAYVGSHKTFAKGAKPVKEIAERCEELAKLPNELPAVVKPAFMTERLEAGAEFRVRKACKDLNVMRFHRGGRAIQVVKNHMGAASKLLRF